MKEEKKSKSYKEPVSLDAQTRLMQVMNNTPTIKKLAGTEWAITALKPAVMWQIAEEVCKIEDMEGKTYGDALKGLVVNIPSVVRILTLALLNDKRRIEEEYDSVYQTLIWESDSRDWGELLKEILLLMDTRFFFASISAAKMLKEMTTMRKMTKKEVESLSQGQNTEK